MCWQAPKQRSVIDRASQGGSDWPRRARVEAGELRAMVDAMATTRMRGDATTRRKYAELEKLTLAAGEQWQQTAFAAWARQSRGREFDPKVDDLQASTSSTSSVGLGGRITGESAPRAPMPQRVQRQAARCARALTGRPPEPSSRIKPRADSTSEVTMSFRRPNDMTAATGRGAERCWAGSAAVQESPSPLLHATRPPQQGRREGRCSAGLASDQGTALPRVASTVLGGHGGLFCDRTDVGLFLHGLRPVYSHVPPWNSHKQPELARCPPNPSAKASWSQPFDVAALQWFRWIGPARWIDVLAVQKNACKKVLSPPACQYRVPP